MPESNPDAHTDGLRPVALRPLSLGQLRPAGWLAAQLQLQADGMAGHLDEVWADVANSAWIGGDADGWERGPYWLDGVVPLAHLLDDDRLRSKAKHWIDYILEHQDEDGWIGPRAGNPGLRLEDQHDLDVWPRMIVLKVLLQHWSATSDERVVPAVLALTEFLDRLLAPWPLRDWGRFRWAELARSLQELYDATGRPHLLKLADTVYAQGYRWQAFADQLPYPTKRSRDELLAFEHMEGGPLPHDEFLAGHGVNVAMGLKEFPVRWRQQPTDDLRASFDRMLAELDAHHGQATGLFSADEHLAGPHPSQGTETCAVVELLLSLAVAIETWGPVEGLVDRWERIAYNALPAAATADERGHQYDQQANQVICHVTEDRPYTNNGPDANIFGLTPHFGCCTANRHQGWPKFAARQWMATPDDGLLALTYAPCEIATTVRGVPVQITVRGDYPFGDEVEITISADRPVAFPLRLRIPGWADGATLTNGSAEPTVVSAGSTHTVERTWTEADPLRLRLPAAITTQRRFSGSVALRRGPLHFALAVDESWRRISGSDVFPDWEVHPEGPWNYALELDPDDPGAQVTVEHGALGSMPYSPQGAPVRLRARARRLPSWTLVHGAADAPPQSPVETATPSEDVMLLPYGAARLRVTELPWTRPFN